MDIQSWFDRDGSFAEGVELYKKLPIASSSVMKMLSRENSLSFLKLKTELKKALLSGYGLPTQKKAKSTPNLLEMHQHEQLSKEIIEQAVSQSFQKETMAMYPMELHPLYRERVSSFYLACELKFKLNALPDDDQISALQIIHKLEDLWTKIDRAWMILDHWKEHNRIMPTEESEDFSKMNGVQLAVMRGRLETSLSKRRKTLKKLKEEIEASPEDKMKLNSYHRKLEQAHQIEVNLSKIKKILHESCSSSSAGVVHSAETGTGPDPV